MAVATLNVVKRFRVFREARLNSGGASTFYQVRSDGSTASDVKMKLLVMPVSFLGS
jgi:hypothetical protein